MQFRSSSKRLLPVLLGAVASLLAAFNDRGADSDSGLPAGYESLPAVTFSVQQPVKPQADGFNLRLQAECRAFRFLPGRPVVLSIYANGADTPVLFYDDGTHGDPAAVDGRYTAQFREDVTLFLDRAQAAELRLATGGMVCTDTQAIKVLAGVEPFDLEGFIRGQNIPISALLVAPCASGPQDGG